MAKTLTFTIQNDAEALDLLDRFCSRHRYLQERIDENETKIQFFRRITVQWWRDEAAQGKLKEEFAANRAIFDSMQIDSSDS